MQISIIIPAHNEKHFIEGVLDSINNHLKKEVEIIVVDNGSTDGTNELVKKYNCDLVTINQKVYPSKARNIGVSKAKGDCLIFLDADVLITQEWAYELDCLLDDFESLPEHFITGSSYYMSCSPSWIESFWFEPLRLKSKDYINGGNIITTRSSFDLIDGFDEILETGEDVDFCSRAKAKGVEILINDKWKVHHEGFPKTIKGFIKRESWHGKGDFFEISKFIKSKIAIFTVIFLMLHVLILFFSLNMSSYIYSKQIILLAVLMLLGLCVARAAKDISMNKLTKVIVGTFISYIYFVGRSISIWRVIKDKITKIIDK